VTTVRVPVTVRVEVTEDRVDDELVALVTDAVDAALGRAVDRALAVRLVSEATDCRVVASSVSVSGDPVPGRVSGALEESLLTSVDLAAARLTRRTTGSEDVEVRSGQGERLDDDRLVVGAAGDAYQVPYYDHDGKTADVRLHGMPPDPGTASTGKPHPQRLRRLTNPREIGIEIVRRIGGVPAETVAVIGAPPEGDGAFIAFVDFAGTQATVHDAMPLGVWDFPGGNKEARLANVNFVSADRWSFYGQATGESQVQALLVQAMMIDLMRDAVGVGEEDLKRQALKRIKRLPARTGDTLYLYQLTAGGAPVWIGEAEPRMPRGPMDVVVVTEDDPEEREDTYGKCPPLDSEEPSMWLGMLGLLHDSPSTPDTPFLGEPAVELFPPAVSARLSRRMSEVAGLLHMSPGKFVGGFLIAAMVHIDTSCRKLTHNRAPMGPQLRNMAAAFGPVQELKRAYINTLLSQDDRKALPCPVAGQSREWVERFADVLGSARDDAVASMFVTQCQDVLLQVLFSSGHELHNRAENFASYMKLTRMLLTVMLADVPELMGLRGALADELGRERLLLMTSMSAGGQLAAGWIEMTGKVMDSVTSRPESRPPEAGTVARFKDGLRVYDGKGRWWSLAELDAVLTTQRQQVTAVDPVLDKVSEVKEVVEKLKAAQFFDAHASTAMGHALTTAVDDFFRELLADLIKENDRWKGKAVSDRKLAFGLANFRRDDGESEIGAQLTGIYKLADERLRPAFADPAPYVAGMRRLADVEIGKAELSEILNLVGLTVLAIFCAPLAFAVGVIQAAEGLETAFEHRSLQRAMLDADEILSKAQVEAEMWAAVIGLALAVVPEVPSALRGARTLGRAAMKGEATELAIAATRQAMREVVQKLAELSLEHFTVRFVKELTQGYLINLALEKAMNRITEAVAHQVTVTGEAGIGDLGEVLGRAIEGGTP
jgi:hypothetical protein